ncbi:DUF2730 family protein [Solimonas flava]|uniref:DUF2730 family protein n=1 Tax=Solimonas flava TaxID=415849 RepID=UPI00040C4397|nr:DUF2730 family protein [Solimonas flava]
MKFLTPEAFDTLKFIWAVLLTLLSGAGTVLMLWASKNFVRRDEYTLAHAENKKELHQHGDRLTRIETELQRAPKHSDLVALAQQVSEVGGRISRLEGQTQQTNHLLAAIHEHLLNAKD